MKEPGKESITWNGPLWKILELHFLSHTHLRKLAEDVLVQDGLGLAHHRVAAFILKYPGITAGELRKILQISNQALGTAITFLIRRGFVEQVTDPDDRRLRHLHLSKSGMAVFNATLGRQIEAIEQAVLTAGPDAVRGFLSVAEMLCADDSKQFISPLDENALSKLYKT